MVSDPAKLKIGYIVKMFPRLSETFILNEILELERQGVEVTIFSIKKPSEGPFHPQLSRLKARALYLEGLDFRKWGRWVGEVWQALSPHSENLWPMLDGALENCDNDQLELILHSAWVAARAQELELTHLHAHFASLPSTVAYFANRITEIPFSFTAHAKDIFVYDMDQHLLRQKLLAARFVITVTNYNYRYLIERAPEIDPDLIKV